MTAKNFYITTPIYYVNDRPHIGHAYTTILGDVIARYQRLFGNKVHYLTGTDEHGQKVQRAAEKDGVTGQEQADATVVHFQKLWERLEITHDDFIRTTESRHKEVVQKILQDLFDKGEIYKAEYDGLYDVTSETFITEKDLPEGCDINKLPDNVTKIKEANYFFKMGSYQEWLIKYIEDNPEFIQPDFRRNETLGFLRKPLQDLCISRPKNRLSWGIDLPFDDDYVCYVWFDALVNYISAIGYSSDEKNFRKWWPANYHLIGKDILTTHTVYWPTMLKAMGVPLPKTIFAHGWWLFNNAKMSKSLGNVVNPMDMIDSYGVDAFRYFLTTEMTPGQDANFSEEAFIRRFNSDLANDLGNLVSRLVQMINKYCGGVVPSRPESLDDGSPEQVLWNEVEGAVENLSVKLEALRLDQGVQGILDMIKATNRYLETKQPWALAKAENKEPLEHTLYTSIEVLRVASVLLEPVMPGKMHDLRKVMGLTDKHGVVSKVKEFGQLKPGSKLGALKTLFPRIETEQKAEKEETGRPQSKKNEKADKDVPGVITIDDFAKVELRTAKIINAEPVAGADKLLKVQVMLGEERRQVIAGIAQHYTPDEIIGKTVVIVYNLKPAKLRGELSEGMLLAASKGEKLTLMTVDEEISSGAVVR